MKRPRGSGARARVPFVGVDGVALALLVRFALLLGFALVFALLLALAFLPLARGGAAGRVGIAARVGGGAPHRGRDDVRLVDDVGRGGRIAPRGSRGGWSAVARRSPREGLRESPRRGVRTPGGRFAARARASEKRRVERRIKSSCAPRSSASIPIDRLHIARIVINWRALRPGRQRPARATGRR